MARTLSDLLTTKTGKIKKKAKSLGRNQERKFWQKQIQEEKKSVRQEYAAKIKDLEERLAESERIRKKEYKENNSLISELRTSQATQIKLVKKVYDAKVKKADDLIKSVQDKDQALNQKYFNFNHFLSSTIARIEKIHHQKERMTKDSAKTYAELDLLKNMADSFYKMLSDNTTLSPEQDYRKKLTDLGLGDK